MPEYIIAFIASTILGIGAGTYRSYRELESRVDRVELNAAKEYLTKQDAHERLDGVHARISRLEDNLNTHKHYDRNSRR